MAMSDQSLTAYTVSKKNKPRAGTTFGNVWTSPEATSIIYERMEKAIGKRFAPVLFNEIFTPIQSSAKEFEEDRVVKVKEAKIDIDLSRLTPGSIHIISYDGEKYAVKKDDQGRIEFYDIIEE